MRLARVLRISSGKNGRLAFGIPIQVVIEKESRGARHRVSAHRMRTNPEAGSFLDRAAIPQDDVAGEHECRLVRVGQLLRPGFRTTGWKISRSRPAALRASSTERAAERSTLLLALYHAAARSHVESPNLNDSLVTVGEDVVG